MDMTNADRKLGKEIQIERERLKFTGTFRGSVLERRTKIPLIEGLPSEIYRFSISTFYV